MCCDWSGHCAIVRDALWIPLCPTPGRQRHSCHKRVRASVHHQGSPCRSPRDLILRAWICMISTACCKMGNSSQFNNQNCFLACELTCQYLFCFSSSCYLLLKDSFRFLLLSSVRHAICFSSNVSTSAEPHVAHSRTVKSASYGVQPVHLSIPQLLQHLHFHQGMALRLWCIRAVLLSFAPHLFTFSSKNLCSPL